MATADLIMSVPSIGDAFHAYTANSTVCYQAVVDRRSATVTFRALFMYL